jgi:hypothetical protein
VNGTVFDVTLGKSFYGPGKRSLQCSSKREKHKRRINAHMVCQGGPTLASRAAMPRVDWPRWSSKCVLLFCCAVRVCCSVRVCGCAILCGCAGVRVCYSVRVCGCAGVRVCGCAGVRVCCGGSCNASGASLASLLWPPLVCARAWYFCSTQIPPLTSDAQTRDEWDDHSGLSAQERQTAYEWEEKFRMKYTIR